jgi:Ser/Thr protein kinase RdoA (MazF antagonist)
MERRQLELLVARWLGEGATVERIDAAMNSQAWHVRAGDDRYVLKIASPGDRPGLEAASWLEARGFRAGAPLRIEEIDGELVALLRFVAGTPLVAADSEAVGATLGRAHQLLRDAPVPEAMVHWPWQFLDLTRIAAADLRSAAERAVDAAMELAPTLTHGILHGDPAPEAFLAALGDVALIDWGAACHGPLLYDVASAWMYTRRDGRLLEGYARTGPLDQGELTDVPVFLAFRWALQAWYFSGRVADHDLTGVASQADNEKGLADAREFLIGRR